tara:strand:- start:133 stop:519 length:387 start_codon:yes stop_codon:yes gene_type:complete
VPYKTYGTPLPGKQPTETVEMASFFNRLRREYPDTYGLLALHIRNEGKRVPRQMQKIKADGGFVKGASDIVIPGSPTFVCEMKSRSKTARLSPEQIAYLEAAQAAGAYACVALGAAAAWEAFEGWLGR